MFQIILYVLTRFYNLLLLPPFVDELLYIRWTDSIANSWKQYWLPVIEDGQPPLYLWMGAIFKSIVDLDTLIILRSLSILFGIGVLLILKKICAEFINQRVSNIAGYIYILFPMFLWYDRLAMRESIITFAGLLVTHGLAKRCIKHEIKGVYFMVAGLVLGIVTKGTAILFIPIIILAYLIFRKHIKLNHHDYFLFLLMLAVALLIYYQAPNILSKGQTFLLTGNEFLSHIYPNLYSVINWIIDYSTITFAFLGILGFWLAYKSKNIFLNSYSVIFTITITIQIFTADIFFPRYFLWVMPFWLIMISLGINWLFMQVGGKLAIMLLLIPVLSFDYHIIENPTLAPLPQIDKWQHITGWPSGYGIREMAEVISNSQIDLLIVENNEACKTGIPYYTKLNTPFKLISDYDSIRTALSQNKKVFACINIADKLDSSITNNLVTTIFRPESKSSLRLYEIKDN